MEKPRYDRVNKGVQKEFPYPEEHLQKRERKPINQEEESNLPKHRCSRSMLVSERNIDKPTYFDSAVITAKIRNFIVKRILVDNKASHDVMFADTLPIWAMNGIDLPFVLTWWHVCRRQSPYYRKCIPSTHSRRVFKAYYPKGFLLSHRFFHSVQQSIGKTITRLFWDNLN